MIPSDEQPSPTTSLLEGFRNLGVAERRATLRRLLRDSTGETVESGTSAASLTDQDADQLSENVIGTFALPFSVALNLRVDGRDYLVPMATEEPSVVAALSRVARLTRNGEGISASCGPALVTAQIHLADVADPESAAQRIAAERTRLGALADETMPRIVARGGGLRSIDTTVFEHEESGQRFLRLHLELDVVDAMGANIANVAAEAVAPAVAEMTAGRVVMAIVSNRPGARIARATCHIPTARLAYAGLDGATVAQRIEEGWRVADADPDRAVTHNKGVMNGVDAAALVLGQDTRAIEAAAHAFASRSGRIAPLSRFTLATVGSAPGLHAEIALPMPVTTVGPLPKAHPGVEFARRLLGCTSARELGAVLAAVGLCQSLAAVQVLVTEGISKGHLPLHDRKGTA